MVALKEFLKGFRNPLQDIKVTGVSPSHFVKSEWEDWTDARKVSWLFVAWRMAYLTFTIFAVVRSMVDTAGISINYWFNFVTNWSILLQMVYCILFVVNISLFYSRNPKTDDADNTNNNGIIGSCVWVLFNIVGVAPYIATLVYWGAVYSPSNPLDVTHKTIFNHGVNALFTFVDTFVVAIPVHVTHAIYLLAYGGVYISFTLLYDLCGGTYPWDHWGSNFIYPFFSWRQQPGKAVSVGFAIVIAATVNFYFLWFLYALRLLIVSKLTKLDVYKRHNWARTHPESIQLIQ